MAERFEADSPAKRVSVKDVPADWRIMDIGETTVDVFARALQDCKMVVWNGPMGVAEMAPFSHGSHRIAGVLANLTDATTIVGGGETAAVVEELHLVDKMTHVSTGGGRLAGVPGGEGVAGRGGAAGRVGAKPGWSRWRCTPVPPLGPTAGRRRAAESRPCPRRRSCRRS